MTVQHSRFRFLHRVSIIALVVGLIASSAVVFAGGKVQANGKLQVFFSGNVRGKVSPCGCRISKGGVIRLANFIEQHQEPDANCLIVDAGNFVDRDGSGKGCSNKCQLMIKSYETIRYDAMNIAGQELALGYETLKALRDSSQTATFISANLVDVKSGQLMFKPYVIKEYDSMSVGVIGLVGKLATEKISVMDTSSMRVTDANEAAAKYISEMKERAGAIVVVCELQDAEVKDLVTMHPEIDLVILSGLAEKTEVMRKIGRARVMGTGSSGYNGHFASLEFNSELGDAFIFHDVMDILTDKYEQHGILSEKLVALGVKSIPPSEDDESGE